MMLYGGIEAGGTKFVCMVGRGPDSIVAETTFPTAEPAETINRAIDFFRVSAGGALAALGVASFGPVDLSPNSPTYGYITTTPKPGWAWTNIVGSLSSALNVPVVFDTDVNGAAYGEYRWGAARGLSPTVYVTVGTGIGGGVISCRRPLHGLVHPEIGHMLIPHDRAADPFDGICPFHGDCLEGLASGPAIGRRWGQPAETLPPHHEAWSLEARYLGLAAVNLILCHSPLRVILGGGVMQQPGLIAMVREEVERLMAGYLQVPSVARELDRYIVPPALGGKAGVLGAIALAMDFSGQPPD